MDVPRVIDIRNLGLVAGIELEPRAGAPGARAMEVFHRCYDTGLLTRVTGDIIALSPPLISEPAHFTRMAETLADAIKATA
jgi:beta-alanine--pyruvate transaminase